MLIVALIIWSNMRSHPEAVISPNISGTGTVALFTRKCTRLLAMAAPSSSSVRPQSQISRSSGVISSGSAFTSHHLQCNHQFTTSLANVSALVKTIESLSYSERFEFIDTFLLPRDCQNLASLTHEGKRYGPPDS